MSKICPECGSYNPPEIGVCHCGRKVASKKATRFPLYLAALPLILPVFLMYRAMTAGSEVASAVVATRPKAANCVTTYGLKLSETQVLSGTARNICKEPVRNVRLAVSVTDDDGKRRTESVEIKEVAPGGTQLFQRVLGGRVKSWEIASDK